MDATQAIPATAIPADAVITSDLECLGCGYNLRTLSVSGRCPECGLAVARSLLVLPQPETTAGAIKLAAWALLVRLLLSCVSLQFIGDIMLLIAAHRLHRRCGLGYMQELGGKVRWLWRAMVASIILTGVILAFAVVTGSFGSLFAGPSLGSSVSVRSRQDASGLLQTVYFTDVDGPIELSVDPQGRHVVRFLDDSGNVVSADILAPGQNAIATDAGGQSVTLSVDSANTLMISPQRGGVLRVPPGGGVVLTQGPMAWATPFAGIIYGCVGLLATLVSAAATVLYVLVCRGLAIRANKSGLARRFKLIIWLLAVGFASLLVTAAGALLVAWISMTGTIAFIIPAALGILLLLIAVIMLIVGSFRLAAALRDVPRHWSDVAAVPAP